MNEWVKEKVSKYIKLLLTARLSFIIKVKLIIDLSIHNSNDNHELTFINTYYKVGIEWRSRDAVVSETYTLLPSGAHSPMERTYFYEIITQIYNFKPWTVRTHYSKLPECK